MLKNLLSSLFLVIIWTDVRSHCLTFLNLSFLICVKRWIQHGSYYWRFLGVVEGTYNPSTKRAETGGLAQVQGQPHLYNEFQGQANLHSEACLKRKHIFKKVSSLHIDWSKNMWSLKVSQSSFCLFWYTRAPWGILASRTKQIFLTLS